MTQHSHWLAEGRYLCELSDDEIGVEAIYFDDLPDGEVDIYGNIIRRPDWSGADSDLDGETLIDNLLSGEYE